MLIATTFLSLNSDKRGTGGLNLFYRSLQGDIDFFLEATAEVQAFVGVVSVPYPYLFSENHSSNIINVNGNSISPGC